MSLNAKVTGNDLIELLSLFKVSLLELFENKEDVLDKLSVDNETLLFNGKEISTSTGENVTFNEYDNTSTYSINDYVIYNNKLYKCIVNVNTPEDFEEDKWKLLIGQESSKITIDNLEW